MTYNTTLIYPDLVCNATKENFESIALQVFAYQYSNNTVYRQYCDLLSVNPQQVKRLTQIPFLPISFFKTHIIIDDKANQALPNLVFESSGTTADTPSRHYVRDPDLYEKCLLQGFSQFYGEPGQYTILALLPSYLERENASLVYMAKVLMEASGNGGNGFYLNEWESLSAALKRRERDGGKTLLLGVTFALLDFAAAYPMPLSHTIVMETGGMKGRKKEMTRDEVHEILKKQWHLKQVHSEYGMTELLSQAYATSGGIFQCSDTMRVFAKDINDPLDVSDAGNGCLNIVDLANIHSCSFIATEYLGNVYPDGSFEVLGRMDSSALRGCSLMAV